MMYDHSDIFFSNKIQETILFLTIWTFSNQWEEDVCSTYRNLFFCLSLKSVNHTFSCNEIHRCACYNHTYFRRRKKKFIIILPRKNKEESCLKNLVYTTFANIFFFLQQKLFSHMFFNLCQMILSNDLSSFGNDCNNTCQSSQLELAIQVSISSTFSNGHFQLSNMFS